MSRKNVITALGIFKKQAVLWVANRAWSPVCLCLISSIRYCCINPIHVSRPSFIIPFGKRKHSLQPAQSSGFTGEPADTWPRASIVRLAVARQKQGWLCRTGAKLPGRTNMFFHFHPTTSFHGSYWNLTVFGSSPPLSNVVEIGPHFCGAGGGRGEERESERENRAKNNNVWIFPGHLSWNIRKCNV